MRSLLFLSLLPLITSHPHPHPHALFPYSAVLAFGDSYTYIQGQRGHGNYSFIGDAQHLTYTPSELLSNAIVQNQTGTAEGGPNWVQFLTGCGVREGLSLPAECEVELWDFAFAGSGVSEDFLPLHHDYTVSLESQISQYLTYGEPVLAQRLSKNDTLIASWIGINDINDSAKFTNISFPAFYNALQDRHFELMAELYDVGYRNFLFNNLPPLDRTPGNVIKPAPLPNRTMIGWWDDALREHADAFAAQYEDVKVLVFDVNSVLNEVLDEPEKWGFTNTTAFCPGYNQPDIWTDPERYGCQPQNEYFWYNSGHLTSKTHEVLVEFLTAFFSKTLEV